MLNPRIRLHLQEILRRLAVGHAVTLQERITLQKYADRNPTVWSWLRQAQRQQRRGGRRSGGLSGFLEDMNLGAVDPDEGHDPRRGDLGDWFGGAPEWVRRS
jgi:hypothetical protein